MVDGEGQDSVTDIHMTSLGSQEGWGLVLMVSSNCLPFDEFCVCKEKFRTCASDTVSRSFREATAEEIWGEGFGPGKASQVSVCACTLSCAHLRLLVTHGLMAHGHGIFQTTGVLLRYNPGV